MQASLIIPTFRRPKFLPAALDCARAQDLPVDDYEVLLVDNAPEPTPELAAQCDAGGKPSVRYIHEPRPGLDNARHAGAKAARGAVLVYADDDVTYDRSFLTEILKPYSDPDVGCVGGKILPEFEVEPPDWLNELPKWYLSILDDEEGPKEVKYIFGCNFSIRRALLFEVGGFNPDAFGDKKMWWYRGDGEIGLLKKVQAAGFKTIYTPAAVVWHFIPRQRLTKAYFRERAFKSGIEASFSEHRYGDDSLDKLRLSRTAVRFGVRYLAHGALACVPDRQRLRHRIATSYYRGRCLYELKLMSSRELKTLVKNRTWLRT
jgi:glycosyltransferase involved in cell wall biosynthesis